MHATLQAVVIVHVKYAACICLASGVSNVVLLFATLLLLCKVVKSGVGTKPDSVTTKVGGNNFHRK